MFTNFFQEMSFITFVKFLLCLFVVLAVNSLLKKIVLRLVMKKGQHFGNILPKVYSFLNWTAFYSAVVSFLFIFSKSKWLFYPIFSQGEVDVSVFLIVTAIMAVSLANKLVKLFIKYVLSSIYDHYHLDKGLGYTFNQMIYYSVMIGAVVISFASVGLDLTALSALFGVLGIGLGFGMRNIAGNFVSGIIILFERPIEVGEVIQIDKKIGRVEKIRLRSTVVRTAKEGTLIVPNQYFIEQIIKNRTSAEMMAQVTVCVEYGTDPDKVDGILAKAVEKIKEESEGILDYPIPEIRFINFRNKAFEFLIEIPVVNFEKKEQIESRLRHIIAKNFLREGIQLGGLTVPYIPDEGL